MLKSYDNNNNSDDLINECKSKAIALCYKYIAIGSDYEINISYHCRNEIINQLFNDDHDHITNINNSKVTDLMLIFNRCGIEMVHLLNDSFSRFKRTKYFGKLVAYWN